MDGCGTQLSTLIYSPRPPAVLQAHIEPEQLFPKPWPGGRWA